jgi:hypothetical protein
LAVAASALTFYLWFAGLNPTEQRYFATYGNAAAWTLFFPKHAVVIDRFTATARNVSHVLEQQVYGGHSLLEMLAWPGALCLAWLLVGIVLGDQIDNKRIVKFRKGRKLAGWDVLTPGQYNKRTKGDGFALLIQ